MKAKKLMWKILITAALFIGNGVFFVLLGLRAELGIGMSASLFLIPVLFAGAFWGLAGGLITAGAGHWRKGRPWGFVHTLGATRVGGFHVWRSGHP